MRRVAAIRDEQARAELARLDRAILAKAFRGELVPQDPNDEPAPVLLERIRAEREKTNGEAAGRKSKKGVNGRDGSTPRRGRPRGTHEARE